MHFAICVFGLLRSLRYCIDSIRTHCLQPITDMGHTYDIFVHTYTFSGNYSNDRNGEGETSLNFSEWKLLNPYFIHIEDQDKFDSKTDFAKYATLGDPWHNQLSSLKNHIRALHSIHYLASHIEKLQAHNQNKLILHPHRPLSSLSPSSANDGEHSRTTRHVKLYDGIIYLRPDVIYLNNLPIEFLVNSPNTLFVPDFHRSCGDHGVNSPGQYNDRFAMGNVHSGIIYGKRLDYAYNYSLSHKLLSEVFVYDYLNLPQHSQSFNVIEIPFRFQRVRVSGNIHNRDVDLPSPSQQLAISPNGAIPHQTNWLLKKFFYSSNIDDPFNIYCSPNPKILPSEMLMIANKMHLKLDNVSNNMLVPHKYAIYELMSSGTEFIDTFIHSSVIISITEIGDKTFFITALLAMQNNRVVVYLGSMTALVIMHILSSLIGFLLPELLPILYINFASILLFFYFGIKLLITSFRWESDVSSELNGMVENPIVKTNKEDESRNDNDVEQSNSSSIYNNNNNNSNSHSMSSCYNFKKKFKQSNDGDNSSSNNSGSVFDEENKSYISSINNRIQQFFHHDSKNLTLFIQTLAVIIVAEWGDRSQIATIALAASKNIVGVIIGGLIGHAFCTGLAVVGGRLLTKRIILEKTLGFIGGMLLIYFAIVNFFSFLTS